MRILLAEDDRIISQGLIAALRKSGYAVDHVNNGADDLSNSAKVCHGDQKGLCRFLILATKVTFGGGINKEPCHKIPEFFSHLTICKSIAGR